MFALLLLLLSADPERRTVSAVPCKSVSECWLDVDGKPIARPKRLRAARLPKGDCGKNLRWLRHALRCEEGVCTSTFLGDEC